MAPKRVADAGRSESAGLTQSGRPIRRSIAFQYIFYENFYEKKVILRSLFG